MSSPERIAGVSPARPSSGGLGVPPERPTGVSPVAEGALPPARSQSPGKPQPKLSLDWQSPDCLALLALLAVFAAAIIVTSSSAVPIDQACPAEPERVAVIAEKIDPNTASAASLRRLPDLGPKRTAAILAYRQEQAARTATAGATTAGAATAPGRPVFQYLEDLGNVYTLDVNDKKRHLDSSTINGLRGRVSLPSRTDASPADSDEEEE